MPSGPAVSHRAGVIPEFAGGGHAVRDSKDPSGPVLRFTPAEWAAFTAGVRDGEFNS